MTCARHLTCHCAALATCFHAAQPEDVVQDVAADACVANDVGWVKLQWRRFLQKDMFAAINKDERLLQLHSTAEQYDATAEGLFHQLVVCLALYTMHRTIHAAYTHPSHAFVNLQACPLALSIQHSACVPSCWLHSVYVTQHVVCTCSTSCMYARM